ncbi:MAG: ADP-ribosylglycohydrolase family protein [Planctomycetes bacterium]|nr:ADP-ribosylglycohydrolase family protein [Planctomycetota bacterium]
MPEVEARALETAVLAAREAAELLRGAFHRPRPAGDSPHKAHVDCEAELAIREALGAAFPSDGIRGEEVTELDRPPAAGSRRTWLIDPQDGTEAFSRGWRGPAVSIALVEDGVPVLGVVFAYAAPDDRGDLFSWAEGCGPPARNGRPIARPPWPERLGAEDTVLASLSADADPAATARWALPARFRCVPSIAYRLALAAAGDAAAAVSTSAPADYDFAAGHALLRAAGGELVDEGGRPVRYEPFHAIGVSRCFGGSRPVADTLSRAAWSRRAAGGTGAAPTGDADLDFAPVSPTPGRSIADPRLLSRAQGCLLGQISGDSLGSLVEFCGPEEIARAHPGGLARLLDGGTWSTLAGQPTDDSELALLLARSLVKRGGFDRDAVLRGYCRWYESDPFDVGTTTGAALGAASRAIETGREDPVAAAAAAANRASQANGALMRVSPLAVLGWSWDPARLAEAARQDAALTHPHPVCGDASAAYCVALANALRTGCAARETYEHALDWARRAPARPEVVEALVAAETGPPEDFLRQQGWVLKALRNAFHRLLRAASLEEGVRDTVLRGGDTDTNAAIAGALLGAHHGREGVPAQWADRVLTCRPIAGLPAVRRPRPRELWPVEALVLAERLLVASREATHPPP